MRSQFENIDVYKALVAALDSSLVPTSIMSATIVGVGLFACAATGAAPMIVATAMGGLASASKILLLLAHARRNARGAMDRSETRRWEVRHGLATLGMATSVGALASIIFVAADLSMQMVATGLVFGYCSGIVSRISIRPRIASAALTVAAVPTVACAAWIGDAPHRITAVMFGVFYLGALDSVSFAYRAAASQICQRVDMASLARRDPLTGLFNRLGLREAFRASPSAGRTLAMAVHCLDLDGFKAVNDRFGHAAGDMLLRALGSRLCRCLSEGDIAARIGGDEFVVVQPNVQHPGEAQELARRLALTLGETYDVGGCMAEVGISLGYAVRDAVAAELDEMLAAADAACYRAKRRGGGVAADGVTLPSPDGSGAATQAPAQQSEVSGAAAAGR